MELFGRRYFGIGSNEESLVTSCELSRSFEFHFTLPALCVMNNSMQQNGLRGEIMFPSCWGDFNFLLYLRWKSLTFPALRIDGENVDSSNHISHMAYPADVSSASLKLTQPPWILTSSLISNRTKRDLVLQLTRSESSRSSTVRFDHRFSVYRAAEHVVVGT